MNRDCAPSQRGMVSTDKLRGPAMIQLANGLRNGGRAEDALRINIALLDAQRRSGLSPDGTTGIWRGGSASSTLRRSSLRRRSSFREVLESMTCGRPWIFSMTRAPECGAFWATRTLIRSEP